MYCIGSDKRLKEGKKDKIYVRRNLRINIAIFNKYSKNISNIFCNNQQLFFCVAGISCRVILNNCDNNILSAIALPFYYFNPQTVCEARLFSYFLG